jgi:5-methylcytosine-specific restriction endonuclease McrA
MPSYKEKLLDQRWQTRRFEILQRDNDTCQACGLSEPYLHVHHKYYTDGADPWDYPDDCLVSLCPRCHSAEHGLEAPRSWAGKPLGINNLVDSFITRLDNKIQNDD